MSSMRNQFEKELKNKLSLKSSGYTTEETVLLKAFKYFDLDNSGCCSKNEFIKAINKIGITGLTEENLEELFSVYDVDGSGELDYKEFVGIIFNRAQLSPKKQQPAAQPKKQDQCSSKREYLQQDQIQEILDKIREKLASRGVRGICSIAKNFAIIDDDNSHVLSFDEFKKCCKDFRFGLNEEEIELAFSAFDRDNSGNLEYDEFLRTLRGDMNDFRKGLVEQAFNILDKDKSGIIDMEDIKDVYNAKNHPDVKNGKRTEDEVLMEFIETFESTYNYLNGDQADGKVSIDEFMEYYENVSMSIDDDAYFQLMIANAWGLEGNTTYNNKKKGWSNKDEEPAEQVSDNYNKKFGKKTGQQPKQNAKKLRSRGGRQPEEEEEEPKEQQSTERLSQEIEKPIKKLRAVLNKRGGKGIIGLARQFKIFDDNNSKTLDIDEFTKAMKDYQVGLSEAEIRQLFQKIDRDSSGLIDYDEFLRKVRGKMNETRKRIVLQAFDKLDVDGSGIVEMNDIKTLYNAKNSKDVLSGKKTEEDVYGEFIETFETHHNIKKGIRDRRVTKEEFLEYYNNISMSIDNDDYFIEMIKTSWKLGAQPSYVGQQAWSAEVGSEPPRKKGRTLGERDRKPGTAENAPFGTDNEPVNYSTSNNPRGRLRAGQPQSNAGNSKAMKFSNKGDDVLIYFRERMAARGTRGIMSMRRAFMIADDDNSKTIDINEFAKFCHDYRIELSEEEVQKLFEIFDRDHSGAIDYDEFVRSLVGEMSQRRIDIVKKAFNKLDKNGNGMLEVDDIKGTYNASRHPDVQSGKKTEDEVLAEFLDTFEYHFSLLNMERTRDAKISLEEFIEYYTNISMSIDDDEYFEVMMTNAYNLDNKPNYGKGWKGEY